MRGAALNWPPILGLSNTNTNISTVPRRYGLVGLLLNDTRHFFLFLPVAFALGISAYFAWPTEPSILSGPSVRYLALLPIVLLAGGFISAQTRAGQGARAGSVFCACMIAGAIWAKGHTSHAANVWETPAVPVGGIETRISGQVDMSEQRWRGGEVNMSVYAADLLEKPHRPFRARLFSSKDIAQLAAPGCHVELDVRLQGLGTPLTDGGYDPRFPAYFEGLRARGFIRDIVSLSCETGTWRHRLARLRQNMAGEIRTHLPPRTGGVATALITGLRGGISPAIRDTFRDSGLAHVLAISGLHMALFAGTVFALFRFLCALFPGFAQRYDIRRLSACLALAAAIAYLAISGASYATQRAFIMIALMFIAIALGRQALTMRNVSWAAFLVLLINPHAVMQVGFQMSFAAVIVLIGFFEAWRRRQAQETDVSRPNVFSSHLVGWRVVIRSLARARVYVFGLILTSLLAGGATGVLALIHFNQMAKFGLAGNLIAMPVFGMMVMPAAFVSVVLMPFGLAAGPLWVMGVGIDWIIMGAQWLVSFATPVYRIGPTPAFVLPAFLLGLIWLCLIRGLVRWAGLAAVLVACLSLGRQPAPDIHILGRGYQMAWRTPAGDMAVLHPKRATYETEIWRRRLGSPAQVSDEAYASCRFPVCSFEVSSGAKMVFVHDPRLLSAACRQADIIIAPYLTARYACAAHLVDRRDLTPFATSVVYISKIDGEIDRDYAARTQSTATHEARPWHRLNGTSKALE